MERKLTSRMIWLGEQLSEIMDIPMHTRSRLFTKMKDLMPCDMNLYKWGINLVPLCGLCNYIMFECLLTIYIWKEITYIFDIIRLPKSI